MKTLKRRRHESKTDYAKRLKLLKSGKPRIVFRKTNNYLIGQYVTTKQAKDKVEIGLNSKKLLDYGWPDKNKNSLKTVPAAYLLGLILGKKILKASKESPIVDFGMIKSIHKSKAYGFLKGLVDSGLNIKSKKEVFPSEDRIQGKHLKSDFSSIFTEIKSKIEKE